MSAFHLRQYKTFQQTLENNNTSHAYVLSGPNGVGRYGFSVWVAQQLLDNVPHPDFHVYQELDIDQVRDLKKTVNLSPFSANYKVVVVKNAERMNRESSNAILKLLEDPRGDTIFFLITTNTNLLLDTIRSRCYEIKFQLVPNSLIEKEFNTKPIENLKPHWSGRPEEAKRLLEDAKYKKQVEKVAMDYSKFSSGSIADRFNIAQKYDKMDTREEKLQAIRIWMESAAEYSVKKELFNIYKSLLTTNSRLLYSIRNFAVNYPKA